MAWQAPMTAIAGSILTAPQFNTFVRDNLNETLPALATTPGSYFVGAGVNSVVETDAASSLIETVDSGGVYAETTNSNSYADLDTFGPSVTLVTQVRALVVLFAQMANSTASVGTWMSYEVSDGTSTDGTANVTSEAQDNRAILQQPPGANDGQQWSAFVLHQDLTPGSNTFTAKYRVSGGTGSYYHRRIAVLPF